MASRIDYKEIAPLGSHDPFDWIPAEINEMILKHLANPDLLSCGLVSKSWKHRSRSYLQKHRECLAYVKNPCKDLLALNNQMSRYDLSMINGIHIRSKNPGKWAGMDVVNCCPALMQFPLKYLYVRMRLEDETKSDVKLVKALIRATRLSLNKLGVLIHIMDLEKTNFFDFLLATCEENAFPELMVFESLGRHFPNRSNWYLVLPAIAPKLQNIFGTVRLNLVMKLDVSLVKSIRDVNMAPNDLGLEGSVISAEYFAQTPAAHLLNLRVFEIPCGDFTLDEHRPCLQILLDILHNNRNALEKIQICPFYLLQYLKHWPTVRFPKLKALELRAHECIDIPCAKQGILQRVNSPESFPSLKEVTVDMRELMSGETEQFLDPIEDDLSVYQEPLTLKLRKYNGERDDISFFGLLSPRVTTLDVEVIYLGFRNEFCLADAFLGCPMVEELIIQANDDDRVLIDILSGAQDNMLDAFLCGIHVDEVSHVLEQHRSGTLHLQDLNIVPVRPPVTFAPNLKRLCLRDFPGYFKTNPRRLTEVSGYLAFLRMPEVEVTIEIDIKYRHEYATLTPFANITYLDEDEYLPLICD